MTKLFLTTCHVPSEITATEGWQTSNMIWQLVNSGSALTTALTLTPGMLNLGSGVTLDFNGTTAISSTRAGTLTSLILSNTTNQIVLGTTNTVTITSPAPTASRTYTIPDAGANATFAVTGKGVGSTSSSSNPTGTTNTTAVEMGLGYTITPAYSGKLLITITGSITNNTNNDGALVQINYGTGTAPSNGGALTGTAVGSNVKYVGNGTTTIFPFCCTALVTGLTNGTTYWIDAILAAVTGGTATISAVTVTAVELP